MTLSKREVSKQAMSRNDITLEAMRRIFRRFRGSQAWAGRELNVTRCTIARYLGGHFVSAYLAEELPRLAERLLVTDGRCIGEVNGKSVRHAMRGKRRKR